METTLESEFFTVEDRSSKISNDEQSGSESYCYNVSEHLSLSAGLNEKGLDDIRNSNTKRRDMNSVDDPNTLKNKINEDTSPVEGEGIESKKLLESSNPESSGDHNATISTNIDVISTTGSKLEEGDKEDQSTRLGGIYQSLRNSFAVRTIVGPAPEETSNTDSTSGGEGKVVGEKDVSASNTTTNNHPNNREKGRDGGAVSGVSKTLSSLGDTNGLFSNKTSRPLATNLSVVPVESSLTPAKDDLSTVPTKTPITANKDQRFVPLPLTETPSQNVEQPETNDAAQGGTDTQVEAVSTPLRPWFMPMSLLRDSILRTDDNNVEVGDEEDIKNENYSSSPQRRTSSFWWTMGQTPPTSVRERHVLPLSRPRASYPLRSVSDKSNHRHSSSTNRIKLIDNDSGCIAEQSSEDTFQVSIRIRRCMVEDVVDIISRPDMLLQWCECIAAIEILNAHETHLNSTDLAFFSSRNMDEAGEEIKLDNNYSATKNENLRRSTKKFDAEWMEASVTYKQPSTTQYRKSCFRRCYEKLTHLSSSKGVLEINGKLLIFVERRRKQIALTFSNFEKYEVSHTLNFVQSRDDVHVSDVVCVTTNEASNDDNSVPDDDGNTEQKHNPNSDPVTCCHRVLSCPADCVIKMIGPVTPMEFLLTDHMEQAMSSMKRLSTLMSTENTGKTKLESHFADSGLSTPLLLEKSGIA